MSVRIQVSQEFDRPVAPVFHFYADEHVRNHPRWDPDIQLEQVTAGPIGVGTIIHRRNTRYGAAVEETMEVTEFEPNRVFGAAVNDGPMPFSAQAAFESIGDNRTRLTTTIDFHRMDESTDQSFMRSRLERSRQDMKRLIESET